MSNTIKLERYSVGDCEMLASAKGNWIKTSDFRSIIDWLEDNDDRAVILNKLEYLKDAAS